MSDLISRADAICEVLVNDGIENIVDRINKLPSAELPADAEFADLPDIPRYYYEKVVGNMAHEINMLKEQLESADAVQGEWGHMMIDGNKLMLALSEWWYSSFGLEETEESKAIHKVMDEVERYVDHEKSADYWIPCSERLPSVSGTYIVTTVKGAVCLDHFYADSHEPHWSYWRTRTPLCWMPLPKPYKGGDDK